MLKMFDTCETCGKATPAPGNEAMICSFECTFCRSCAEKTDNRCPNCKGELQARPSREEELLQSFPATVRVED